MPRRALAVLFVVSLARAAVAGEAAPKRTGIYVAANLGWGMPIGKVGDIDGKGGSPDLSNRYTAIVPLALELGYRLSPHLSLGATFQYAPALLDNCSNCSGHDLSAGALVGWRFNPGGHTSHWVSLGAGYERLTGTSRAAAMGGFPSVGLDTALSGIQFLNFRGGGDLAVSPRTTVGGFLGVSAGVYTRVSGTLTLGDESRSVSGDIENTDIHVWITFGVRCGFDL